MCEEETTSIDLANIDSSATINLSLLKPPQSESALSTSHLSTGTGGTPFVLNSKGTDLNGETPKLGLTAEKPFEAREPTDDSSSIQSVKMPAGPFMNLESLPVTIPTASEATAEEEKKEHSITKQSSIISTGGGVALSGTNKLSLGFYNLNSDFSLPSEFNLVKKLGKGAYGRVMQILHMESQREYACKRYEHVFSDTQRARRLLREMTILKKMSHPCCNQLLCVIPPGNIIGDKDTPIEDLTFNEVYLVLRKCDMDLKKLIKSGKHLEET